MRLPIIERASHIIPPEFLTTSFPVSPAIDPVYSGEGEEPAIDLLRDTMIDFMRSFKGENRAESDGLAAEIVHRSLALSRRDAAENRFWHYVAICKIPEFVVWRHFDVLQSKVNQERYSGAWQRNAFGRLWWWAELACDPDSADPYIYCRMGSRSQEFMLHTLDDLFGGNSLLVRNLVAKVFYDTGRLPDDLIRKMFALLNTVLVTHVVDLDSPDNVRKLVESVIHDASLIDQDVLL